MYRNPEIYVMRTGGFFVKFDDPRYPDVHGKILSLKLVIPDRDDPDYVRQVTKKLSPESILMTIKIHE